MRSKEQIIGDGTNREDLMLEVLLDIRELLKKQTKKTKKSTKTEPN
jgi:hypothetical protein